MSKKPRHTQPGLMDPPTTATGDRAQQQWQSQLTQVLRTGLGQSKDTSGKFLTWSDLENEGIVTTVPGGGSGGGGNHVINPGTGGGGTAPEEDRTPPPAPKNFAASGAMTCIYLTWDNPNLGYDYRIEIHRSAIDDVGTADLHGSGIGTIYQDVVGSDKTKYFYWSRFVKQLANDAIIGPWNQTKGTSAQASEDAQWVLDQISGKFDADDLKTQVFEVDLFGVKSTDPAVERMAFAIDTTTTPPRVAMDGAYIINATINDAQIGNLNVDKLIGGTADFVETNIREGSITNAKIGNYIQSINFQTGVAGWQINKNGQAEFMDLYARGLIEGSIIRGSVIEGGLMIDSGVTLTVPTEADSGPGTRRFLCLAGHVASAATPPFSTENQIDLNMASADYIDEGWDLWGEGEAKEEVWNNFIRYKPFLVTPAIVIRGQTDSWLQCIPGMTSAKSDNPDFAFSLSVYSVKLDNTETLIATFSRTLRPKYGNESFGEGYVEFILKNLSVTCCSSGDGSHCNTITKGLYMEFRLTLNAWNFDYRNNHKQLRFKCNRQVIFDIQDAST